MTASLDGQHILVTGGGSGIARAAAERYLEEGASVCVIERSLDRARELREASQGRINVIVGDALDTGVLIEGIERASDVDGALHNLTCGVGVFDNYCRVTDLSVPDLLAGAYESWRLNVLSSLLAVNLARRSLERGSGSVTLTVSESAYRASGGGVLYGTAKWALRGMVEHLAVELAPLVRVNGVAPGGTGGTRFNGLASLGQTVTADQMAGRDERIAAATLLGLTAMPRDHSGAYRFLADPVDARMMTGVVIRSDGGHRT